MNNLVEFPPTDRMLPDGSFAGGWWHAADEPGRMICDLCPRACALRPGDRGFCFVRENRGGEMVLSTYGRSTGFCIDPIEKKPLNHFYPGSSVLSFGTAGCNLGCKFCQNWSISKSREVELLSEEASPEAIAQAALQLGCRSVAFTYNDPVVWAEYAIDVARACRAVGVKTVAVTAGYITPQARGPFFEAMDAANVDLKGFTEEFYRHLTLSHLQPVLDTLRWLKHESDVWFEITNLVIPRANDSPGEIRALCQWVLDNLGADVPLHFTAFHPDFRLTDRPHTPADTLLAAHDTARSLGLRYVYVGNISAPAQQATWCPGCGRAVIERQGYTLTAWHVAAGRCAGCGVRLAGHFDERPGAWGARRQPVRIADFAPRPAPSVAPEAPGAALKPSPEPAMHVEKPTPTTRPTAARQLWTPEQLGAILQRAAGQVVAAVLGDPGQPGTPEPRFAEIAGQPLLGAFISLKRGGKLRSCCGCFGQLLPLGAALSRAAERAANEDPRFPPVSPSELPYLDLEVWLLDGLQRIAARGAARRQAVKVGLHGLQVSRGTASGLLLPGVAIDNRLDAEAFLEQVCAKAGLPTTAWQEDDTQLATFRGQAVRGPLADWLSAPWSPPDRRFSSMQLAELASFCLRNVLAVVRGATPDCYAAGAADGNVQGVVLALYGPDGRKWLHANRLNLGQALPLQATLYALAEGIGRALVRNGIAPDRLTQAEARLLVLTDPALHGTAAEPDLRGFDPLQRALVAIEGRESATVFAPTRSPHEILGDCARQARVRAPDSTSVFSLAAACNAAELSVADVTHPQPGPAARPPAVAGGFYPSDASQLRRLVDGLLPANRRPPESWPAVMVPHAGLAYSGRISAEVFSRVRIPETVVILGPKHTRDGVEWSVAPHEEWLIPGSTVPSDAALARELAAAIPGLELDAAAHRGEHAIEVELPFLARLSPSSRVVGISLGGGNLARCRAFAGGLARVLGPRRDRTLLVISSDLNHFAPDAENRRLDELALAAFERLDPAHLLDVVTRRHISMCGVLPAVVVLETLRLWGTLTRSLRTGYATSADTTGDKSRVVGYAGMLVG
jgi:AmmeMemoRadiSam system radical SAM enzyme/AmmeMemoRadiSam system protein B/AmmeMemoRadiSam system protein A